MAAMGRDRHHDPQGGYLRVGRKLIDASGNIRRVLVIIVGVKAVIKLPLNVDRDMKNATHGIITQNQIATFCLKAGALRGDGLSF